MPAKDPMTDLMPKLDARGIPYKLLNDCLLIHGCCLEVLPLIEAGSVDAVVTDPIWPNVPDGMFEIESNPSKLFCDAMNRVPSETKRIAVHLGCNSDPRFLTAIPERFAFFRACWLEYVRPGYLGRLLYTSDVAYMFGDPPPARKGNFVISGYCQLVDSARERFEHPCVRQRQHVEWLVNKWSDQSEVILDPFAGSFTTAVACLRTGRKFIGIEREKKYFDIGVDRVRKELERHRLFEPAPVVVQGGLFDAG